MRFSVTHSWQSEVAERLQKENLIDHDASQSANGKAGTPTTAVGAVAKARTQNRNALKHRLMQH